MADDAGQEHAVPRYRDPEKAARIVEARRRGEKLKDIAAREGLSRSWVCLVLRNAGLTRSPTTSPSAGKALYEERRDGAATWIEVADALGWRPDLPRSERTCRASDAARGYAKAHGLPWPLPNRADPVGKRPYELRRDGAATWPEIVGALGWRPDLRPERRALAALQAARRYAKANGLTWPLPDRAASERRAKRRARREERERAASERRERAASERMARRDERERAASERRERAASERMARQDERERARVREMVEEERRVLALVDELPKDRTITEPEAERFLVELYRIGLSFDRIAGRTNCAVSYVLKAVRRLAPELIRPPGARPGKKPGRARGQQAAPLLDLRELRYVWRDEKGLAQVREMVEEERRVLALADEFPKDRTITEPEAERFLVELYRVGLTYEHIAARTNCSQTYVMGVMRRRAPELIRPGAPRGKKRPQGAPLLDLRELRIIWRGEERLRRIDRPDAPMFAAWLSGE